MHKVMFEFTNVKKTDLKKYLRNNLYFQIKSILILLNFKFLTGKSYKFPTQTNINLYKDIL